MIFFVCECMIFICNSRVYYTATRSGISTGREGPVAPVPEPVLPFRD